MTLMPPRSAEELERLAVMGETLDPTDESDGAAEAGRNGVVVDPITAKSEHDAFPGEGGTPGCWPRPRDIRPRDDSLDVLGAAAQPLGDLLGGLAGIS
jgi:hypothetical protein